MRPFLHVAFFQCHFLYPSFGSKESPVVSCICKSQSQTLGVYFCPWKSLPKESFSEAVPRLLKLACRQIWLTRLLILCLLFKTRLSCCRLRWKWQVQSILKVLPFQRRSNSWLPTPNTEDRQRNVTTNTW